MAAKQYYWHEFDSAICDPISLEPVCEFRCEPFQLGKTYFDCEMLAHYLISTATFVHPTTRERITRENCMRLDSHIAIHLPNQQHAKVTEAFDLLTNIASVKNKRESESMQREAAAIFQQLFVFRSRRNRNPQQQQQRRRQGGGGFAVIDDDEARFAEQQQQQQERLTFDLQRDFPRLFSNELVRRGPITRKLAPAVPRGGGQIQHRAHLPSVVVEEPPMLQEEEHAQPIEEEEEQSKGEEEDTAKIEAQIKQQLQNAARQRREEKAAAAAALRTKQQQQQQPVIIKRIVPPVALPIQANPPLYQHYYYYYIFTALFVAAIASYCYY